MEEGVECVGEMEEGVEWSRNNMRVREGGGGGGGSYRYKCATVIGLQWSSPRGPVELSCDENCWDPLPLHTHTEVKTYRPTA